MTRAFLLLALLAGCGPTVVAPPADSFRTPGTMISSTTRGGPADLAGEWVVSLATPGGPVAPGRPVSLTLGTDMNLLWTLDGTEVATAMTLPGRYEGERTIWVLWVDDDFRTAVVGTPDGSFGWIMDRPGAASPDRTLSARAIMQFNGYDVSRLVGP